MIFEYACHEGNYALTNILSGERAQENERRDRQKQQQMKRHDDHRCRRLRSVAGVWSRRRRRCHGASTAQAPASIAKPWTMPRTPDGKPDLQGNWTNATLTPLERAEGHAARHVQGTKSRTREKGFADRVERLAQTSDPNRPAPPKGGDGSTGAAGNVGGYNNFWIDPGRSRRASSTASTAPR